MKAFLRVSGRSISGVSFPSCPYDCAKAEPPTRNRPSMLTQTSSPVFFKAGDFRSGVTLTRTSGHGAYVEITKVPGDLIVSPEILF